MKPRLSHRTDRLKRVEDIVREVEGIDLRDGDPRTPVEEICRDSRAIEKGGLFAALCGEQVDGHDFIDAAVENGASAVLVEKGRSCDADAAVLETARTRSKLGQLASWFYDHPSRQLDVVAVTGTNGKTSVSYLLEQIFASAGRTPGIIGTVEYRWKKSSRKAPNTTPDGLVLQQTLRKMVDDGVDIAVVEVSSHGLELGRVDGTCFAAGVFTNLSRDHVEFHGSVDAYRRAKWRLFNHYLPQSNELSASSPVGVVNLDDDEGRRLAEELENQNGLKLATHGTERVDGDAADRHFAGRRLRVDLDGISMTVDETGGESFDIEVGLPGRFNAENTLGAVATARMLDIEPEAIVAGLNEFSGIPGRMQPVEIEADGPAVFVDYAHTPDALRRALETLRNLSERQLIVVFGCGGDRDESKRAPMGRIAAELADRVVVTSDNPRSEEPEVIIEEIVKGVREASRKSEEAAGFERQTEREVAIRDTVLRAGNRDVILIAGKGHETYQEQNGRRRDFDDRRVAKEALRRRGDSTWEN